MGKVQTKTTTNRPVTHRRILAIAFPIVLSNATVPLLGAFDTGVVGQLGEAAPIGAVGIGAIILTAVFWMFGFLRMGTAGLVAQADGAGDQSEVVALLMRTFLIAGAAGFGLICLQTLIFNGAFWISPASPEVETLARQYMGIRIWSAPAAIALYGITGWLIARARTGSVLIIQVSMNGLNIGLDVVFVLWLDYGVGGVAFATFLAEWAGLVIGLWLCRDAFVGGHWRDWGRVFDRPRVLAFANFSRDILIRSFLLQMIFLSFLFLGADFGDVPLAANQILLQFLYVTSYAMDGFAFAAEAIVGNAMGAGQRKAFRRGAQLTTFWAVTVGIVLAAAFLFAGHGVIDLMTSAPDVRAEAKAHLAFMVLAPILGAAAWMLDGIFIGGTGGRDMRNMMFVSAVVYALALWVLIPIYGNAGLWTALLISFVVRGITLGLKYPDLERKVARAIDA